MHEYRVAIFKTCSFYPLYMYSNILTFSVELTFRADGEDECCNTTLHTVNEYLGPCMHWSIVRSDAKRVTYKSMEQIQSMIAQTSQRGFNPKQIFSEIFRTHYACLKKIPHYQDVAVLMIVYAIKDCQLFSPVILTVTFSILVRQTHH